MVNVALNYSFQVTSILLDDKKIYFAGQINNLSEIVEHLQQHQSLNHQLFDLIAQNRSDFFLIITGQDFTFACVDRVRTHPLFYSILSGVPMISNDSSSMTPSDSLAIDQQSLLQFSMAGYVLGRDTLYPQIKQLQAGECLLWKKGISEPLSSRYYTYLPVADDGLSMEEGIETLGQIFDKIFDELIAYANGRPILVPLSGGLDSRLILAKLVEKKYDNVSAFTYGIKGNHEMLHAKEVARRLKVKWIPLVSTMDSARSAYLSLERQRYEKCAHGLSVLPFYGEFEALMRLTKNNSAQQDTIIVNGQTGDFIVGGHVREPIMRQDASLDSVLDYIIEKHFSLWLPHKTPENIDKIKQRLEAQYNEVQGCVGLPNFYEYWEWQERQSKNVVRSQRLYEFFGFDWKLPFWHADLMDFFAEVPYSMKINQRLYINYLQQYNYKKLFSLLRRKVQPWSLKYRWIPYAAKWVQWTKGPQAKANFYKKMDFYSTYHHQYALYGREYFLEHYPSIRNPESLMMRDLLDRYYL